MKPNPSAQTPVPVRAPTAGRHLQCVAYKDELTRACAKDIIADSAPHSENPSHFPKYRRKKMGAASRTRGGVRRKIPFVQRACAWDAFPSAEKIAKAFEKRAVAVETLRRQEEEDEATRAEQTSKKRKFTHQHGWLCRKYPPNPEPDPSAWGRCVAGGAIGPNRPQADAPEIETELEGADDNSEAEMGADAACEEAEASSDRSKRPRVSYEGPFEKLLLRLVHSGSDSARTLRPPLQPGDAMSLHTRSVRTVISPLASVVKAPATAYVRPTLFVRHSGGANLHTDPKASPSPSRPSNAWLGIAAGVVGVTAFALLTSGRLYSDASVVRHQDNAADGKGAGKGGPRAIGLLHEVKSTHTSGTPQQTRPVYTRAEVSRHTTKQTGIWVLHGTGVYDVTEFVDAHPGGERILLAAGRSIDPFWGVFTIHQSASTKEILEQYRIGDLFIPDDPKELDAMRREEAKDKEALKDLFANDPKRHPDLIKHATFPCNAESPVYAVEDHAITPNPLFFVRNHLPVPKVDATDFKLVIDGDGLAKDEVELTMTDLRKLPKHTITATLQCAGNRRKHMSDLKPTKGLQWQQGAISTATWSGVLLRDVLHLAEFSPTPTTQHVQFHGTEGYGASIPLPKATSSTGDVLLAYEMNGESIPLDHGYPLRVIVPGHVAARSVKWVDRITLSDEESHSHWQRRDYKGFSPGVENPGEDDYNSARSIQELPVQSAVTTPRDGATYTLPATTAILPVKGYALSGGGRDILRVDVSSDGGRTWTTATLHPADQHAPQGRQWAWAKWEAEVPVSGTEVEIVCKAVDEAYNSQPEGWAGIWNARGVLSTAWHRVRVSVERGAEERK
ncbi:uncharacterized protein EV422DRAFT_510392 [Fimicolochytrium jonesii]|uniref:uncharacterized protein n=1 Tax=Fimicolochytrium jonesii TaxID=1396493 RepID=UPI0022FEF81C|nr:uncharacterized protein EV422DRAFT_510392 [Fimicolochytrium jonesii]KAI8815733.1 hypothetical protein EV422DRAFT_510392 [Fimicolochytrium jonesii]